jgi:hypothetical protein
MKMLHCVPYLVMRYLYLNDLFLLSIPGLTELSSAFGKHDEMQLTEISQQNTALKMDYFRGLYSLPGPLTTTQERAPPKF